MAKTLYHSALVQMGDVQVIIKSEVTPSKYKGKPPFVTLHVENEDRNYNTENAACEAALRGRNGQKLTLRATGSRDDATIQIIDGPAAHGNTPAQRQQAPPAAQRQQERQSAPPPTSAPASPVDVAGSQHDAARIANLILIALDRAVTVQHDFDARHDEAMTLEQFQSVTSSIFISLKDRGWIDHMPADRKLELKSRRTPSQQ